MRGKFPFYTKYLNWTEREQLIGKNPSLFSFQQQMWTLCANSLRIVIASKTREITYNYDDMVEVNPNANIRSKFVLDLKRRLFNAF